MPGCGSRPSQGHCSLDDLQRRHWACSIHLVELEGPNLSRLFQPWRSAASYGVPRGLDDF